MTVYRECSNDTCENTIREQDRGKPGGDWLTLQTAMSESGYYQAYPPHDFCSERCLIEQVITSYCTDEQIDQVLAWIDLGIKGSAA